MRLTPPLREGGRIDMARAFPITAGSLNSEAKFPLEKGKGAEGGRTRRHPPAAKAPPPSTEMNRPRVPA